MVGIFGKVRIGTCLLAKFRSPARKPVCRGPPSRRSVIQILRCCNPPKIHVPTFVQIPPGTASLFTSHAKTAPPRMER
jgi:hypothetical protein